METLFSHLIKHYQSYCGGGCNQNSMINIRSQRATSWQQKHRPFTIMFSRLIKTQLLSTLFYERLSDMSAERSDLHLHNNIRWLSKGNALKGVCELRQEIVVAVTRKKQLLYHNCKMRSTWQRRVFWVTFSSTWTNLICNYKEKTKRFVTLWTNWMVLKECWNYFLLI